MRWLAFLRSFTSRRIEEEIYLCPSALFIHALSPNLHLAYAVGDIVSQRPST
jgi:hypothetical protein